MKMTLNAFIQGYSGRGDGVVYYYDSRLKRSLVRRYVYPQNVPAVKRMTEVMANIKLIQPSEAYKYDLTDYRNIYSSFKCNDNAPLSNWNSCYMKLLFALQRTDPRVDLLTLSREQIYEQDLPCNRWQPLWKQVCCHMCRIMSGLLP